MIRQHCRQALQAMRIVTIAVAILLGCAAAARADVSIQLDAGTLRTANGAALMPQSGLLQLIASPSGASGTFGAPSSTSFVSGDNIVVASFSMNYFFGRGETSNTITLTYQNTSATPSPTQFDQGDALLLRWWPTLTTSSTVPGSSTTYGQFRSNTPETFSDGTSPGLAWFAPADGTSYIVPDGLNFVTSDITSGPPNGTYAPSAGFANFSTVPEPSMWVFMTGMVLSAVFVVRAQRAKA